MNIASLRRSSKEFAKKLLWQLHRLGLKFNLIVVPDHYYTPIANVDKLRATKPAWARPSSMHGIDAPISRQATTLIDMVAAFEPEFRGNAAYNKGQASGFGPGFGFIEAQCLHGVLRSLKPRRIVEIGSGVSTYCSLQATNLNKCDGRACDITCIEPNPSDFLRSCTEINLIQSKVEETDPAFFDRLQAGDFLFIDSSHAVKVGGDVLFIYLEILPRLRPGVVVHIHDIYFPYRFSPTVFSDLFQWTETALLEALLTNNPRLEILFSLSMLHYADQAGLRRVFPEYDPRPTEPDGLTAPHTGGHFPASTYLITK